MLSSLSPQHATTGTRQAICDLERGDEGHHLTDEVYDRFVIAEEISVYLFYWVFLVGLSWAVGLGRTYVFGEEERDHDDYSCYYAQ